VVIALPLWRCRKFIVYCFGVFHVPDIECWNLVIGISRPARGLLVQQTHQDIEGSECMPVPVKGSTVHHAARVVTAYRATRCAVRG
jgi:hypothetical protein